MINKDWLITTLDNSIEQIIDYRGKTPKKTESGIPLITAKIVKEGFIQEPNEFIAKETYKEWMVRGFPKRGDVVLTMEGPLGEVAQITDANVALGQRLVLIRGKKGILDNTFLKYFFQSNTGQAKLKERETGTTVTGIKQAELRKVQIPLPPLPEQRAIAEVLSSLDDKIELNRRMNRTLEQLAQAIYKHMFIDNPEREGWGMRPLSTYADFIKGVSYSSSELVAKSNSALVSLKSINRGGGYKVDGLKAYEGIYKAQQKISPGEVVVAHTDLTQAADVIGRAAIVEENESYTTLIASLDLVIVRPKKDEISNEYLYCLLSFGDFPDFAYGYTNGTTVLHLSSKALEDYSFPAPPQSKFSEFSEIVTPIFKQIELNNKQSRTLEKLRDTLLPKLMSGQVRVKGKL